MICDKLCKSKRGLSRHKNSKHKKEQLNSTEINPESKLHPQYFKDCINKCSGKIVAEGCYSDETPEIFKNFHVSFDEALHAYNFIRDVITDCRKVLSSVL